MLSGDNHLHDKLGRVLLSTQDAIALEVRGAVNAAVLVPLYLDRGRLHAVFTKRQDDLRRHPGEISFPGGRYDEPAVGDLSDSLRRLGLELGRLKTGTCPRLAAETITRPLAKYDWPRERTASVKLREIFWAIPIVASHSNLHHPTGVAARASIPPVRPPRPNAAGCPDTVS